MNDTHPLLWATMALLVALCVLLFLAFLGYLPSPLSTQLEAHDQSQDRLLHTQQVACGYLAHLAKGDPLKCYGTIPGYVSTGTR